MGLRQQRLADQIRDIVGPLFSTELNDPRLKGVTITHAKVSGDLQIASLYFRIYSDGESLDSDGALEGLVACTGYLRRVLSNELDLRRVPDLRFFYDESVEYGSNIEHLLAELRRQSNS